MAREKSGNEKSAEGTPVLRKRLAQVRAAERSGESLKAYAARHGLSVHTLYQAKKQARHQGLLPPHRSAEAGGRRTGATLDRPQFVEAVRPLPVREATPAWRLRFANGDVLESCAPLSGEQAARVIEALRGRS